jgi:hypothetical protein
MVENRIVVVYCFPFGVDTIGVVVIGMNVPALPSSEM